MASSKARAQARGQSTAGIPLATPNRPARATGRHAAPEPEFDEAEASEDMFTPGPEPDRSGPSPWLQWTTFVLAVIGLGISVYETYAHFTGNHLAGCPSSSTGTFDCSAVITSPESMVFGVIPVAILGLAFYLFAVAIFSPWAWRTRRREVHWLRLASMIVGMGFVMYLIFAEVYQIGQICEYCTGVHIVTFVLFCLTVVAAAMWGLVPSRTTESGDESGDTDA